MGGDEANAIEKRGAKIVSTDLDGPGGALVAALEGQDVVISAIRAFDLEKQIPLVDAAREAGVKRFVPCDFGTISPPTGVMVLREKVCVYFFFFISFILRSSSRTEAASDIHGRRRRFTTISRKFTSRTLSSTSVGGTRLGSHVYRPGRSTTRSCSKRTPFPATGPSSPP